MNPIELWLVEGKDYAAGIALLAAYGDNPVLLKSLQQGESIYRSAKLEKELRRLIPTIKPVPISPTTAAKGGKKTPKQEVAYVSDHHLPEEVRKVADDPFRKEWHPLYIQMQHLRHTLIHMKTDKERCAAVFRILDLERQCLRYWERRRYYELTGTIIEDQPEPPKVYDLNKILLLKRRNISKRHMLKKRLALAPNNTKQINHLQELEEEWAALKEHEKEINL